MATGGGISYDNGYICLVEWKKKYFNNSKHDREQYQFFLSFLRDQQDIQEKQSQNEDLSAPTLSHKVYQFIHVDDQERTTTYDALSVELNTPMDERLRSFIKGSFQEKQAAATYLLSQIQTSEDAQGIMEAGTDMLNETQSTIQKQYKDFKKKTCDSQHRAHNSGATNQTTAVSTRSTRSSNKSPFT